VVEDFIIPDETPSQKTRRAPITHIGRDSNPNSSSTTKSKRHSFKEGTKFIIDSSLFPQRGWLSRTYDQQIYFLDSIGGGDSFVYMINSGLKADHDVTSSALLAFLNNKIRLLTF
jgi:hypothetical protein